MPLAQKCYFTRISFIPLFELLSSSTFIWIKISVPFIWCFGWAFLYNVKSKHIITWPQSGKFLFPKIKLRVYLKKKSFLIMIHIKIRHVPMNPTRRKIARSISVIHFFFSPFFKHAQFFFLFKITHRLLRFKMSSSFSFFFFICLRRLPFKLTPILGATREKKITLNSYHDLTLSDHVEILI